MSNIFGALVGAAIDREDGDSGIKGAIVGSVVQGAVQIAVPILATYALGWGVQYALGKGWDALTGDDLSDAKAAPGA